MLRRISFILALFLLSFDSYAGTTVKLDSNFKSNLPILILTSRTKSVDLDAASSLTDAYMWLIDNGPGKMNYLKDSAKFRLKCGIRLHGASSLGFDKKSFTFQLEDASWKVTDKSLLGMPKEHDWDLIASYMDRSLMRNALSQHVFQSMGHYSSRYVQIEVIVAKDYKGVYLFLEKAKRGPDRINIAKLTPSMNSGDSLTGGYVIKTDWNSSNGWSSAYAYPDGSTNQLFGFDDPDYSTITTKQKAYIKKAYSLFEDSLYSNKTKNRGAKDAPGNWRKYADEKSIRDYMFTMEMAKNLDDYRASFFMYKDRDSRGGKIHLGPVWDFDITWYNGGYQGAQYHCGWEFLNTPANFWWIKLMGSNGKMAGISSKTPPSPTTVYNYGPGDADFKNESKCVWTLYRRGFASDASMDHWIDSNAILLNGGYSPLKSKLDTGPAMRNFIRWPIWGTSFWDQQVALAKNFKQEIDTLKGWIHRRFAWMDKYMPGTCMRDINAPVFDSFKGKDTTYLEVNTHYKDSGIYFHDDFGDSNVTISIGSNLDSATLGTYVYSYFLSDKTGNTSSAQRVIIVIDTIRPSISLTRGDTTKIEVLQKYTDADVVISDNYDQNLVISKWGTFNFPNGIPDTLGYYYTWYKAVDQSGNVDSVMHVLQVVDTHAPVISFGIKDTVFVEVYDTYSDSDVTISDNFDKSPLLTHKGYLTNFVTDDLGIFKIWYIGTDHSGNSDSMMRIVKVIDTLPPVMKLVGNDSVIVMQDSAYKDAGYSVTDNYKGNPDHNVNLIVVDTTGDFTNTSMPGIFMRTYTGKDYSNNIGNSVSRVITVLKDTTSGIEDALNASESIRIFPNPGMGEFLISVKLKSNSKATLNIYDGLGRALENMQYEVYNGWSTQIHLEDQPAGIYTVKLQTGNSVSSSRLVLIK